MTSLLGFVCLKPAPSTFDDVVQLRKAWFPPNSGSIWRTAFRRSSSTRSGERQDPPFRASVAFGLGGWCCLRRRQVSNAFQSGNVLGYGAARAIIARVRNTPNIPISSFMISLKAGQVPRAYSRFPNLHKILVIKRKQHTH